MTDDSMYSLVPLYRSPPTKSAVVAVAFSPDGQRLAYGTKSGRLVVVYDLLASQLPELDVSIGTEIQIVALRWWTPTPDAALRRTSPAHLVAGDSAGYIHFVRLPRLPPFMPHSPRKFPHLSVRLKVAARVHLGCIEDIAIDASSSLIGTASADEVRIWKCRPTGP